MPDFTIIGQGLNWILMLLLGVTLVAWQLSKTRLQAQSMRDNARRVERLEEQVRRQAEQIQSSRSVIKRHLTQSLEQRGQVRALQQQLGEVEGKFLQKAAYQRAIKFVRNGRNLNSLISRGDLNPAEARLIQLVHSSEAEKLN